MPDAPKTHVKRQSVGRVIPVLPHALNRKIQRNKSIVGQDSFAGKSSNAVSNGASSLGRSPATNLPQDSQKVNGSVKEAPQEYITVSKDSQTNNEVSIVKDSVLPDHTELAGSVIPHNGAAVTKEQINPTVVQSETESQPTTAETPSEIQNDDDDDDHKTDSAIAAFPTYETKDMTSASLSPVPTLPAADPSTALATGSSLNPEATPMADPATLMNAQYGPMHGHQYHFSEPFNGPPQFQPFWNSPAMIPTYPPSSGLVPNFPPQNNFHHLPPQQQYPQHGRPSFSSRNSYIQRTEAARPFVQNRPPPTNGSSRPHDDTPKAIHPDLISNDRPSTAHHIPNGRHAFGDAFQPDMLSSVLRQTDPILSALRHLEPVPNLPASTDSLELASFVRGQFANRDFADHVIHINHSGFLFPPTSFPGHGLILARSPKLRSLMAMSQPSHNVFPRHLTIIISDRFINHPMAMTKAVMRLYGEPLLDAGFLGRLFGTEPAASSDSLQFSLAYAAAGHFLQLDDIVTRGLELASSMFTPENLSKALAFALEGGLSPSWSGYSEASPEDRDSSSVEGPLSRSTTPASAPAYGIYSDRLLTSIVSYIKTSLTPSFALLLTAPQSNDLPRLPPEHHRHSRSDSRLAQIRFGEMALASTAESATHSFLSSILFSLPFPLLKNILEDEHLHATLGQAKAAELARTVVSERELRRSKAAAVAGPHAGAALDDRLGHNLRWVEQVVSGDNGDGPVLARMRVGDGTPSSSAASGSGVY